jgi:hypothetical protein
MAERGKKLSGALRRDPKNKPTERLSPGVYRGAGGGLVTQGGKPIQRQPQAQNPANWTNDQMLRNLPPGTLTDFANRYNNGAGARIGEIAGNVAADQSNILFGNQLNPGASVPQFDPNNPGQIQNGLGQPMTMPQMPQASANNGGRYRLSPGVYGTQQQAMNQYNQQMGQFNARLPAQLMKKY